MASIIIDTHRTSKDQNHETNGLELNDAHSSLIPGEPRLRYSLEVVSPEAATVSPLSISSTSSTTQLTFSNVFALLVGEVIGSGIFSSASQVDINVPSPGVAILIWICGGLVAWVGAACFAELGAAIPKNGGMQEYLSYIYGDLLASVMSWTWIMAVKPSSTAILSIIFTEYWTNIIGSPNSERFWLNKLLAVLTLSTMVLINAISAKNSTRLTDSLLFIKLLTVASMVAIAILVAAFNLSADGDWPGQDWRTRNWFTYYVEDMGGSTVDWMTIDSWEI